jgi:hypothetical protein
VEFAVTGPDGMAIATNTTAAVTVTAVDSCATVSCPSQWIPISGSTGVGPTVDSSATRFVLTAADTRTWILYLRNTDMPSDLIKVDDAFDMTIQARVDPTLYPTLNQTIVLAQGSSLKVFASDQNGFGPPPLPKLEAFGVAVTDVGALCQVETAFGCVPRPHAVKVVTGTESATIAPGASTRIGGLSFTNGGFLELKDTGNCDSKGQTLMAGFRAP